MSAPCFARSGVTNGRRFVSGSSSQFEDYPVMRRDDGNDYEALGHEPLLGRRYDEKLVAMQVQGIVPNDPWVDGIHMRWCLCKHCHALVLIPISELP